MSRVAHGAALVSAFGIVMAAPAVALTVSPTSDLSLLVGGLFGDFGGAIVSDVTVRRGLPTGEAPTNTTKNPAASASQTGLFANAAGVYGLPASGVILSTGNVKHYAGGPNPSPMPMTTRFENRATAEQQALLAPVTGLAAHFDPVQLDFTLTLPLDVVGASFRLAFGTEENPALFPQQKDGFALYVNGVNVAGVVQGGAAPGATPLPLNTNHPDFTTAIGGTELDRVLAPNGAPALRFDAPLNAGQANRFSLILADGGDTQVDTTVYIAGSLARAPAGEATAGATEDNPVLPSNPPDATGAFVLEIPPLAAGVTVWIDPPVSVGFVYEATGGAFASVTAPSFDLIADPDGYSITVGGQTVALTSGGTLDFLSVFGVTPDSFTLDGIDPSLMLDPADPMLFPTGVSFAAAVTGASVRMTPITEEFDPLGGGGGFTPVPLPPAWALLGGALLAGGLATRARRR